jgi:hypothetical protein
MAGENSRQNLGERRTSDGDSVQGAGPSMVGGDAHLLTAPIAQRLRDAGLACDIVNLVPTPTAVLRRDRIIVVLALALLTGLAWSYLL